MRYIHLFIIPLLLVLFNCKKEALDEPVNTEQNNQELDCATCPSIFHPYSDLVLEYKETCDDFTNTDLYPNETFSDPGIIGYSQEETQSITLEEDGFVQINEFDLTPGLFAVGSLSFGFDGTEQNASFIVYGMEDSFEEMGFSVNGSSFIYYTETFPYSIDEITIDVDFSIPNFEDWEVFEVTFTGDLGSITHLLFESGITELCVHKYAVVEPPIINQDTYIYFDDFYNYDGTILGAYPNHKTPLGYYGLQATNMVLKFDEFLGYDPTRIGFVHAYTEGQSKTINLQLPDTPLIVTIPDSLSYFLEPYGYNIEHYFKTDVNLWVDQSSTPLTGKVLDSIIIKGNNLNEVTLGANLFESELRSICTYYEQ